MNREFFAVVADPKDMSSFAPSTLDKKNRTVDVVWYGGATVPRIDPETGEPFMLRLDMAGAKLDRLNAGAPVFDSHHRSDGARDLAAQSSKLVRGSVTKAWADGQKGMATLQFRPEGEDEDTDQMFSDIQSGVLRNLSFGAWIYDKEPDVVSAGATSNTYVATSWEPFELSPIPVAADFTTEFLGAVRPKGATTMEKTPAEVAAEAARVANEVTLAAARAEAITLEQQRAAGVETLCATARKLGVEETFVVAITKKNPSVDAARTEIFAEIERKGTANLAGKKAPIRGEASVTRDGEETQLACMQEALTLRANPKSYASAPPEEQARRAGMAREYVGFSLMEMARQALYLAGIDTKGWGKTQIAGEALSYRRLPQIFGGEQSFGGGAETTSDFPSILANVANKTLRQAYQAAPQTFRPFCRQVTAPDFKPINRMQLNDLAALPKLNEKGEFKHLQATDSGISYSLATFGGIIAISRKAIINDDMQAFTRVSGQLGVAASRAQSDTVYGILTANTQVMQDGSVLFIAGHSNLLTGDGSALGYSTAGDTTAALTAARAAMRQQKGPGGTYLDLVPRYILTGTVNETPLLKMIWPLNIASSDVTKVIPEWIRQTVPIIEPRLDAANNPWYMVADPSQIDTIEYCFLEGQEGVYFETRQGFETDGIEMKARMDFAASAIEHRGLQKNAGA